MIQIVGAIALLIGAVLWLPVWIQVVLFVAAIIFVPYRLFLVLPAIFSDALYAPYGVWNVKAHWMTLVVLGLLAVHFFSMKKLRVRTLYGLEA